MAKSGQKAVKRANDLQRTLGAKVDDLQIKLERMEDGLVEMLMRRELYSREEIILNISRIVNGNPPIIKQ